MLTSQVQAQARGYLGQAQAAAAPYLVQAQVICKASGLLLWGGARGPGGGGGAGSMSQRRGSATAGASDAAVRVQEPAKLQCGDRSQRWCSVGGHAPLRQRCCIVAPPPQAALAQLGLQDSIRQAQVQLAAARAAAGAAFSNVETELKALIGGQLRAQPALASYDDPVVIQMLAYAVMGAPLLLLVPLLASCMGGGGGSSSSGSGGRGARSGASSKAAATNGRRAAGAAATPASKRPTRATRGAGG